MELGAFPATRPSFSPEAALAPARALPHLPGTVGQGRPRVWATTKAWRDRGQDQCHSQALAQAGTRGVQGPGEGCWYSWNCFASTCHATSWSTAKPITGKVTTGISNVFTATSILCWDVDGLFMQACAWHVNTKAHFQAFWLRWVSTYLKGNLRPRGLHLSKPASHPIVPLQRPSTAYAHPWAFCTPPTPLLFALFSLPKLGDLKKKKKKEVTGMCRRKLMWLRLDLGTAGTFPWSAGASSNSCGTSH